MRIIKENVFIDEEETRKFFQRRAEKFQAENPYSVTMYQDGNKELVMQRNAKEMERLLPLLGIDKHSKVLDIACGIGRWADALPSDIAEYCGIDFSSELIAIANQRNNKDNFAFYTGKADEIRSVLTEHSKCKYNTVLLIGIIEYLNNDSLSSMLEQVESVCEQKAILCIREPIGIEEKLTLKNFFSEELQDNYNAIYRTRRELLEVFEQILVKKGFEIADEGFLFEEDSANLNNRKETAQYYFILKRE